MKKYVVAVFMMLMSIAAFADVGIATGSLTGTYVKIGQDIQNACEKTVNISVYETAGSLSNIERIFSDKRIQYGIVQQDALAYKALTDSAMMSKIKMIFPLYNEEIHLVARSNSGINSIEDLAGKKVSVGQENSGNWVTSQIIKAKTGIEFTEVNLDNTAAVKALLNGTIDAAVIVGGKPMSVLQDVGQSGTGKLKLVAMKHPALEGFYINSTVPEGLYAWQKTAVKTYAVKSILATFAYKNPVMDKEITALTRCIVGHLDDLQATGHTKWREVDPESYKQVKWPIHPSAQRELDKAKRK